MLTASQIDTIPNAFLDLWEEYQQGILNDISRRIANLNYSSAAWQAQMLIESGLVFENAIDELAKMTGISAKVLRDTFEKAGVKSLRFDDGIYEEAGLAPPPIPASPTIIQAITAGYLRTEGTLVNLTRTTASAAQQLFIETANSVARDLFVDTDLFIRSADIAFLEVSGGTLGYDQAIRKAVNGVGESGLLVTYPTGHTDKLDVAMRRTVLTGVSQTTAAMQLARAQQMGQDLVQVSEHFGSRPSHAEWQGKIYALNGFAG